MQLSIIPGKHDLKFLEDFLDDSGIIYIDSPGELIFFKDSANRGVISHLPHGLPDYALTSAFGTRFSPSASISTGIIPFHSFENLPLYTASHAYQIIDTTHGQRQPNSPLPTTQPHTMSPSISSTDSLEKNKNTESSQSPCLVLLVSTGVCQ